MSGSMVEAVWPELQVQLQGFQSRLTADPVNSGRNPPLPVRLEGLPADDLVTLGA